MNIGVDLSIKFTEHLHHNEIISTIKDTAQLLGCSVFYCDYEMGGKITTNYTRRNHFIITILFDDVNPGNIAQFIKYVNLMHKIYLECVYENDIPHKIIYCSSYYRKNCLNPAAINCEEIKKTTTRAHLEAWLKQWGV
jgi:hypothetical protein